MELVDIALMQKMSAAAYREAKMSWEDGYGRKLGGMDDENQRRAAREEHERLGAEERDDGLCRSGSD